MDLDQNIFTLFARQAARRPDATAVDCASGVTTYGALLARACIIAEALTRRGLRDEQPVGVLMKRTPDLLATLLGIFGAGGCYLPLEPEDPPGRGRRMLESANCQLVLGNKPLIEAFHAGPSSTDVVPGSVEFVDIEQFAMSAASSRAVDSPPCLPNPPAPGGHRLAYILFTSGSTGAPKGVEIEHGNAVSLVTAASDLFRFTESDRWLSTSTVAFDLSVAEFFIPLLTGGVVVLRERQLLLDPHSLVKVIRDHGVTMFQTVPSVWSVLLSEIPDFPRIRVIATTGEAAPNDLARRLVDLGDEVWNLYGPTETTVWATGHRLERDGTVSLSAASPIGRPLPHVEVQVLDEHRRPVPAGTEGELWIGGAGLARGYCGNQELTRERFAALGQDGRMFYQTGDAVVADDDGTLHYFGRCDDQMQVRGVRIEPMEVESAILAYPGVTQAAATWFATASGSRSIVAAVVTEPGQTLDAEDLHSFLVRAIPAAMIPSRFEFCDSVPRTPNGKIDRKAIRARVANLPADVAMPTSRDAITETERTLIGIWERILNIRPVGRNDHFFSIGGDSLSAVSMMLEMEAAFDISLSVRVAFESPTLCQLGERIDRIRALQLGATGAPMQTGGLGNSEFVFPLSQQGYGNPVFFNAVDLRMARKDLWNLDCPLYAVSYWAQGSGFTQAHSIEDLARIQIDGIRSIQPRGPYRLAGYSFGGLIALEIAQQLRRAGETVDSLFLLDPSEPYTNGYLSSLPKDGPPPGPAPETQVARVKRHLRAVVSNPSGAVPYVGSRTLAHVRAWISYHLVHLYGRHRNSISARLLPKDRWPAFWYKAKQLGRSYHPQPYNGRVLALFTQPEGQTIWKPLLGSEADLRVIDTHHLGIFVEPALSLWMVSLQAHLEAPSAEGANLIQAGPS